MAARILLVEDEPTLQRILGSVLTHAGHQVEAVGSAEGALARMRDDAEEFDLVLADKNLPAQNGVELLAAVRDLEVEHNSPRAFVMVTGYPSRDSVRDVLHLGGDGYLVKPFRSLSEAVNQIQQVLTVDLAARRDRTRRARRAEEALTAGVPVDETFALALDDDRLRTRVEGALSTAGARLDPDNATVLVTDRFERLSDTGAVGVWVTGEPAFNDLVDAVWRGGVRWVDPMHVGGGA